MQNCQVIILFCPFISYLIGKLDDDDDVDDANAMIIQAMFSCSPHFNLIVLDSFVEEKKHGKNIFIFNVH